MEEEEDNMLVRGDWDKLKQEFFDYLHDNLHNIRAIISHHLSLRRDQQCHVADPTEWLYGSFNVCVPVSISNWRAQRLLVRCPLPHRFGALLKSDLIDEKLRCEAATFAWISKQSPKVPIPRLWGVGLPNGLTFTPVTQIPWHQRAFESIKQIWAWTLGKPYFKPFISGRQPFSLKSGYLLMDYVEKEQGIMLSTKRLPSQDILRRNFFNSLSKILIDLSQPLDRIGSFTVHDTGKVSLSNRPLTLGLPVLENEGIPTNIPRSHCYSSTDSYALDLLGCIDQKLMYQPNAVRNKYDANAQMASLTMLRALFPNLRQQNLQNGPFIFTLTDLHESNIFVDHQYNITGIVDLEWACSLPPESHHPPFWLNGYDYEDLDDDEEKEKDWKKVCDEFLEVYAEEERRRSFLGSCIYSNIMRTSLKRNLHWFWAILSEPRSAHNVFKHKLQPMFAPTHTKDKESVQFDNIVSQYWIAEAPDFVDEKVHQSQHYMDQLRSRYF